MAAKDSNPKCLYRPPNSRYWYFSGTIGGKRRRISTRCLELEDAVDFRDRIFRTISKQNAADLCASECPDEWTKSVETELGNPRAWLRRMVKDVRSRARKLGRKPLKQEDARLLLIRSGGECELTGIPFELGGVRNPYAPSFDRIDCEGGYEYQNVRVVLFAVNLAISSWGDGILHDICVGYMNRVADKAKPQRD